MISVIKRILDTLLVNANTVAQRPRKSRKLTAGTWQIGGDVTVERRLTARAGTPAVSAVRRSAVMMDVARLAGVSHQTVSRVLNDHPSVRAQTRDRVLEAMRELDYRPNSAARALVTKRSQTL